jgi:hypothetical protein
VLTGVCAGPDAAFGRGEGVQDANTNNAKAIGPK